jgi:hypothetical protein
VERLVLQAKTTKRKKDDGDDKVRRKDQAEGKEEIWSLQKSTPL